MIHDNTVMPFISRSSYGTHFLCRLPYDKAGFPGGQVAVAAVGQVDADLLSSLHLETVHSFMGLGIGGKDGKSCFKSLYLQNDPQFKTEGH